MSTLGNLISKSAPIVGNLVNLALPGSVMVISAIASLFGAKADDPSDIESKIIASPDAYLKLKQFELEHKYDLEQITALDRQSARVMAIEQTKATGKRDWVMEFIAVVMVIGFFGMCFIISFFPLAKTDTNLLYLVLGQFSTGFITVLAYYFGATNQKQTNYRDVVLTPPAQTH